MNGWNVSVTTAGLTGARPFSEYYAVNVSDRDAAIQAVKDLKRLEDEKVDAVAELPASVLRFMGIPLGGVQLMPAGEIEGSQGTRSAAP